jgi:hypothetical protein
MAEQPLNAVYGPEGFWLTTVGIDGQPSPAILRPGSTGPVDAADVTYTPANPTDWPIPPPGDVATALDILAGVRGTLHLNGTRLPPVGESLSITSGPFNVVPEKSGVYLVWSVVELQIPSATAADQAALQVLTDGAPQGQVVASGYTIGVSGMILTQLALVPTNRALPHDWAVNVNTNSALAPGHLEVGRAKIMLLEL